MRSSKTAPVTLHEPAHSKCTWTFNKSHFMREGRRKSRAPKSVIQRSRRYSYRKKPLVWTHCLGKNNKKQNKETKKNRKHAKKTNINKYKNEKQNNHQIKTKNNKKQNNIKKRSKHTSSSRASRGRKLYPIERNKSCASRLLAVPSLDLPLQSHVFDLISPHRGCSWNLLIASPCHRSPCHPISSHLI